MTPTPMSVTVSHDDVDGAMTVESFHPDGDRASRISFEPAEVDIARQAIEGWRQLGAPVTEVWA